MYESGREGERMDDCYKKTGKFLFLKIFVA